MDSNDVSQQSKKKRNKKKNKKAEQDDIDEDELLDQLINENRSKVASTSDNNEDTNAAVLKVDPRQLDPDAEIKSLMEKNMFICGGLKKIVSKQRNIRTIGRVIKMKTGWPPLKNTGLSLDVFEVKNGVTWFRINHNESYRNQQYLFTTLRRSLDIESIMNVILGENPYHLESLSLFAQYFILQEEPNKASDSIEQALFAIEAASHKFSLLSSEHQLEYNWRDNRVFFNLLWHQIQIMAGRNCYLTSLQYAKILFGKNDEDPLAVTLLLDMLALKSKNYKFLVDFYEYFESKRNLDMLPNFLYSTAFAHHCLFEKSGNEKHLLKSRELICKAYTRFPFILSQILSQLSIDAGSTMSKESLFQVSSFERETMGVQMLTKIYLHHTLQFWKQDGKLAWLESTSTEFISNITPEIRKEAKMWADKRSTVFVGLPLNIKRHILLCGLNIDDGDVHDVFDPYPPPNSQADYWPDRKLDEEIKQLSINPQQAPSESMSQDSGPVQTVLNHAWQFFRTIWPTQAQEVDNERWQQMPPMDEGENTDSDEEPNLNEGGAENQSLSFESQQRRGELTTTGEEQVFSQTENSVGHTDEIPTSKTALQEGNNALNIVGSNTLQKSEENDSGPSSLN